MSDTDILDTFGDDLDNTSADDLFPLPDEEEQLPPEPVSRAPLVIDPESPDTDAVVATFQVDARFQTNLLRLCARDAEFYASVLPTLKPGYFDDPVDRELCRKLQVMYKRWPDAPPTDIALLTDIRAGNVTGTDPTRSVSMQQVLVKAADLYEGEITDKEYTKHLVKEFGGRAAALETLAEFAANRMGAFEDIQNLPSKLENALSVTDIDFSEGTSKADLQNLPQALWDKYSRGKLLSTGSDTLDSYIGGGMAAGELHVLMGKPGVGKSTIMSLIAHHNLKQKKNVLYITAELSEVEVLLKLVQAETHYTMSQIMDVTRYGDEDYQHKVADFAKQSGDFRVKYWLTNTASTATIRGYLDRMKMSCGFKPDLIILDYADLFNSSGGNKDNTYETMSNIYYELAAIATKYQCPILTASQPTKAAWSLATMEMEHAADSARKAHIAYSFVSINQTKEEKALGVIRLYTAKVRRGMTGKYAGMKLNHATVEWEECAVDPDYQD